MNRNPDYIFSHEIRDMLVGFKVHLQELGNGQNTIRQKVNYTGYFLTWLEKEHLTTDQVSYSDMLRFIDHCRLEEKSKRHTNRMLSCIRNYYQYLKEQDPEISNPALNLNLRGIHRKVPSGIIAYRSLDNLCNSWPKKTAKDKRNRVILGLLIYQGITTGEHIKSSLHFLFRVVKEKLPELLHPKQIRSSAITHWLKQYNLRQVQYMAGHKHVHSTERYQLNNLDNLQCKLEKFHPLNQNISE